MSTENKNGKNSLNPSNVRVRAKVQELLNDNMRRPQGMFHGTELNESGFIHDLFKHFELTPKKQ